MTTRKYATLIVAIVIAAVGAVCVLGVIAFSDWLPVVRDSSYQTMLSDFAQARVIEPAKRDDGPPAWQFQVEVAGSGVTVEIAANTFMSVASAKYSDESGARQLYTYHDYSSPIQLRVAGQRLYVNWSETLLTSQSWILVYDLANRREILRRRIASSDEQQLTRGRIPQR